MENVEKTYKKVEVNGEVFIEETIVFKKLYPISKYEEQKAKAEESLAEAEEIINLKKE